MSFNPNRRVEIERKKIDRAMFWYEVRLYLKVAGIVFFPFALMLWALLEYMNKN